MEIRLLILGLLMEGRSYGYQLKQKMTEKLSEFADIKFGSIYYSIRVCLNKGYVQIVGKEKKSNDPERIMYKITPEGVKFYKKELKKYFANAGAGFEVRPTLALLNSLPLDQLSHYAEDHIERVSAQLEDIREKIQDTGVEGYLLGYLKQHLIAELAWLKSLKTKK